MRFLTLTQPWATLVAIGAKQIETRSWETNYRGLIGIHAAKGFPQAARVTCWQPLFARTLIRAGIHHPDSLPLGAVVAVAQIYKCLPTDEVRLHGPSPLDPFEAAFGDYSPGRWAWILDHVRPLPAPIPWRGKLGLWYDYELQARLRL